MVEFKSLKLIKKSESGKGVLFANEKGVESWFPISQISKRTDNEDGTVDIQCEDFLKENFSVARVSHCKILSKNDKNTAIRVEQGDMSCWVPMYAVSDTIEHEDHITLVMDIAMAKEKGFSFEIVP